MKNFKLKDLMVSIQPPKAGLVYANNDEVLYESPENCVMASNDACDDQTTKSCSPPSGDDCTVAGRTSCSPPSGDCTLAGRTSCSAPSGDVCTIDNKTSCSPPSGPIEERLDFDNNSIAITELKKAIAALQKLS